MNRRQLVTLHGSARVARAEFVACFGLARRLVDMAAELAAEAEVRFTRLRLLEEGSGRMWSSGTWDALSALAYWKSKEAEWLEILTGLALGVEWSRSEPFHVKHEESAE